MEMTALNLAPSGFSEASVGVGKPPEGGFAVVKGLPEKLAPPGAPPPFDLALMAMGEEGANLKPIASTQIPDFSPKSESPIVLGPGLKADGKEDSELSLNSHPLIAASDAQSVALLSSLGPIVVAGVGERQSAALSGAKPEAVTETGNTPGFSARSAVLGIGEPKLGPANDPVVPAPCPDMPGYGKGSEGPDPRLTPHYGPGPIPVEPSGERDGSKSSPKLSSRPELPTDVKVAVKSVESAMVDPKVETKPDALLDRKSKPAKPDSGLENRISESGKSMEILRPSQDKLLVADGGDASQTIQEVSEAKFSTRPTYDGSPVDRTERYGPPEEKKPQLEPGAIDGKSKPIDGKPEPKEQALRMIDRESIRKEKREGTEPIAAPKLSESKLEAAVMAPTGEVKPAAKSVSIDAKLEIGTKATASMLRQVADRIEALATANASRKVTIRLEPEDLGTITLVVRQSKSEVEAEVFASHDSVRQALDIHRPQLSASLEQRGIQLGAMTVGNELPQGSGKQEQAMREAAQANRQSAEARFESAPTLSLEAIRHLTRKPTGVDLWI